MTWNMQDSRRYTAAHPCGSADAPAVISPAEIPCKTKKKIIEKEEFARYCNSFYDAHKHATKHFGAGSLNPQCKPNRHGFDNIFDIRCAHLPQVCLKCTNVGRILV
jgi:hypothetical protein